MKILYKLAFIICISIFLAILSSCSTDKPEQINMILRIDPDKPESLKKIVFTMADNVKMKVDSQNFDYGGKNGLLKAFLLYDSRTSVMIRGISDEECQSREGLRDPTFSRTLYAVSIYRTSIFKPKISLKELSEILYKEAKAYGGLLLSEEQKCLKL
jgi:hypothetical protein